MARLATQHFLNVSPSRTGDQTDAKASQYIIPVHDEERARLSVQHSVVVRQFGWHLNPRIPTGPNMRVLDVATGTAIWPIELSHILPPSTGISGIDINTVYFPSPSQLPLNVDLSVQNVLSLPPDWSNTFDIVHQRLLVCGLTGPQWKQALLELYRVTKPGGWIQLVEVDPRVNHHGDLDREIGPANERVIRGWVRASIENSGLVWDVVDHVREVIKNAGFVNFLEEKKVFAIAGAKLNPSMSGDSELAEEERLGTDTLYSQMMFFRNMKRTVLELGLANEEEFAEVFGNAIKEWENASGEKGYMWHVYTAQRPLEG